MGINQVPPVVATQEVVSYTTPGTYTFTPPAGTSPSNPAYARVVITGGGGGGSALRGARSGAGGSAGQQIILPSVKITGDVSLTVGSGGAGSSTPGATAGAGGSSVFGSITATGGAGALPGNSGAATPLMPASSQGGSGVDGQRMLICASTDSNGVRFTADGVNWTTAGTPGSRTPTASFVNNGRFHTSNFSGSSGQHYFQRSTDGINWTQVSPSFAGCSVTSFAAQGDTLLAVGTFPNGGGPTNQYMYSTNNGDSWINANFPVSSSWGVALTNGTTWVVASQNAGSNNVRSNTVVVGGTWTARSAGSSSNEWLGGAFGNGRFVITSFGGLIFSSSDGATWTQRESGQGQLRRCAFVGTRFFTRNEGSNSTSYLTSTNGDTWTSSNLPSGSDSSGTWSFGFLSDTYYCITSNGKVHTSSDGLTWTLITTLDSSFVSNGLLNVFSTARINSLGTVSAATPSSPTVYGSDLSPTGGGGGNSTSNTGSGGNGGLYTGVSAAASTGSAAATVGQVPGAGGGGGGTGSTAGAAGADGLVAIYL
jgi:hypothetical protein